MLVLVTHPGRQHSHQAALGLASEGLLAGYWAGVPCLPEQRGPLPEAIWRRYIHYDPVPLSPTQVRWQPAVPALRRLGDAALPPRGAAWVDFAACRLFDRWAATGIDDVPAAAVIACEISALTTFEEAKRRGRLAILDAPSIHHLAQDRLHGTTDPPALHRRIVAVKEREIALADHILTVSELARQTYIEAGVPAAKVHALPLGADLARFAPRDRGRQDAATRKGEIVFLFAGASIRRKGFDILLEAFSRLETTAPFARLRVVGGPGDLAHLRASYRSRRIAWVGPLSQDGLARELRAADCLVLPSRNDSFGMVVAEALASGIPAIVSEMVGAKDLLTEGETGWIVPVDDVERLAAVMLDVAVLPDLTGTRGLACRRAAEQATWAAYHHRLSALLWKILAEVRP